MFETMIGKTVLVRSYDAGVYYGTLVEADANSARLKDVRNIWMWRGATCLCQIAVDGIKGGKVSQAVPEMVINRVCQVIPMDANAVKRLDAIKPWTA